MFFEPWRGWRHVHVTAQRSAKDDAQWLQDLVDGRDSKAMLISIVQADLHTSAALYEVCEPVEAQRLYRSASGR